jgi:hypothetical protein
MHARAHVRMLGPHAPFEDPFRPLHAGARTCVCVRARARVRVNVCVRARHLLQISLICDCLRLCFPLYSDTGHHVSLGAPNEEHEGLGLFTQPLFPNGVYACVHA